MVLPSPWLFAASASLPLSNFGTPGQQKSEIWQSIEKISKNRYYPLKFLEFRVESPKGNEIKEILNFKETTFFDMSSAQPADFLTKYRKNIEKSILPLKILRISCWVPGGQLNEGNPQFQKNDIFRRFVRPAGRFWDIWQSIKKYWKIDVTL